ncbi:anthranilate synthase component I family protein [Paenibacillus caui]|uniref:anthranilate synthase component I family protein n=1 Tax=Paenibacillus caui TaxID=2873927 RepID=UPI001CA992EE|nr:anthranilate synthase component I family protein [Paenibacillus caui]
MVKVLTDLKDWLAWRNKGWSLLPYAISVQDQDLPGSWEGLWEQASPYSFVLESGKDGHYTFAGIHPAEVLRGKGSTGTLIKPGVSESQVLHGQPLQLLEEWMSPYRAPLIPGLPKFGGGFVGYLSYDVVRTLEKLPRLSEDDLALDDYIWMRMDEIWVYDHLKRKIYCIVHLPLGLDRDEHESEPESLMPLYEAASQRAQRMMEQWNKVMQQARESGAAGSRRQIMASRPALDMSLPMAEEGWTTPFEQDKFEAAVQRIQAYIAAGDVFQVNLSLRRQRKLSINAEELYEWFRLINPSPYMGLLRFPDFQLVSGSPELLVSLREGRMGARPIAGTRRRGNRSEEDEAMAAELLGSEKERAEHIMLVDLERNDLGRVAAYGTVKVSELMKVEYYSHVMHLVSQVDAELDSKYSLFDLIAAMFPGGTITGAPKVRTMEIIEELEPVTRGPYTGSIGWIDYQGNMELNIVIRTMIVKDGSGYIQTGAGIVIDSDPYREYRECENKARAARAAVYYSEIAANAAKDRGRGAEPGL